MQLLSDAQIKALIEEQKPIPNGLNPLGQLMQRNQHYRKDFEFAAPSGHEFVVRLRKSAIDAFDFSVILGHRPPHSHDIFRLRRYNGRSHSHSNMIEGSKLSYDFHIHTATERYQKRGGFKEDSFAESTSRYSTFEGAIDCLLDDCGFRLSMERSPLFSGQPI